MKLKFQHGSTFILKNVRHVSKLTKNLISLGQLDDAGYTCVFGDNFWKITKGSLVVARGSKSSTLYMLHVTTIKDHVICVAKQPSVSLWHRQLGHMSESGMRTLSRLGQTMPLHKRRSLRKVEPLQLVHSDVCGPMPVVSMGGAQYFITFIDDFSQKVWVYSFKRKDQVLTIFQRFVTLVETQTDKKVKCLWSDKSGEYVSKAFQDFCDAKGIKRKFPALYNPPQNGVVERMNRIIQEKIRSMLSNANLPNKFWTKSLAIAIHLINMSSNKKLESKVVEEV